MAPLMLSFTVFTSHLSFCFTALMRTLVTSLDRISKFSTLSLVIIFYLQLIPFEVTKAHHGVVWLDPWRQMSQFSRCCLQAAAGGPGRQGCSAVFACGQRPGAAPAWGFEETPPAGGWQGRSQHEPHLLLAAHNSLLCSTSDFKPDLHDPPRYRFRNKLHIYYYDYDTIRIISDGQLAL